MVLVSPLALVCGCAFDLAAARSVRVGGPQPSLPTGAPHLSFRRGISLCAAAGPGLGDAAASCPALELGSALGLWAKGLHLSSSQFENMKLS